MVQPRFAELARFVRSTSDPGLRMLALAALDAEDPAAVEVVRGLREDPRTRPDATLRLGRQGRAAMPRRGGPVTTAARRAA